MDNDERRPTLSVWTEDDLLGPDCGCSSAWEHRQRCERDDEPAGEGEGC